MKITRPFKYGGLIIAIMALSLLLTSYALSWVAPRPPQAQGQSFSLAAGDPQILNHPGIQPADILGIGGAPLIACQYLGILCNVSGVGDDIQALSYGWDFIPYELPLLQFSVGAGSLGVAGSEVSNEAGCIPPEPHADVFESAMDGTNIQDLDGDGQACGANLGYGLALHEVPVSDNLDALERDACQFVDLDCDGYPENPIMFALAPGSPSLAYFGASAADILISGVGGYGILVWASGTQDLGLMPGDVIDALCVRENENGIYDPHDQVLFSLAPGSPSLAPGGLNPADLLRPWLKLGVPSGTLGLGSTDNLDAALCTFDYEFTDIYLPMTFR